MNAPYGIAVGRNFQAHQNFPAIQNSSETTTLTMRQVMMGK